MTYLNRLAFGHQSLVHQNRTAEHWQAAALTTSVAPVSQTTASTAQDIKALTVKAYQNARSAIEAYLKTSKTNEKNPSLAAKSALRMHPNTAAWNKVRQSFEATFRAAHYQVTPIDDDLYLTLPVASKRLWDRAELGKSLYKKNAFFIIDGLMESVDALAEGRLKTFNDLIENNEGAKVSELKGVAWDSARKDIQTYDDAVEAYNQLTYRLYEKYGNYEDKLEKPKYKAVREELEKYQTRIYAAGRRAEAAFIASFKKAGYFYKEIGEDTQNRMSVANRKKAAKTYVQGQLFGKNPYFAVRNLSDLVIRPYESVE